MNILITGASGFIGRALTTFLRTNNEVTGLVRDLEKYPNLKNANFVSHDFKEALDINSLPKNIDAVIHLAQSNQFRNFPAGMRDMTNVNISGLVDILEYARVAGCQHFINFSSGSVYPSNGLQSEVSTVKPTLAYPLTKYISEQLTDLYSEFFRTLNLRLFFPYGPGQQDMLIPNIIKSIKNNRVIYLQGCNGGLTICPIYIDDVISVCSKCLENKTEGLMNVAGFESISLKQISQQISKVINKQAIYQIDDEATPPVYTPNLELLKTLLGSHNLTPFSEGINRTLIKQV